MQLSDFWRFLYFMIICMLPHLSFGQYFTLGQDPASIKWRQISTPDFRIIYPEGFEIKAHKMIHTLEFVYEHDSKTLAFKPKRIPFILHNYTIESNAVTAWAPKRVELFTCPPQDSYAQDWLDQLIIHEYRHVVQFDRANQGFTKILSWFTGEQAATLVNGLYVPSWFLEGDAVCAETALSHSGRGRIPVFEMPLRAQVTQKGAYTYDKAAMGSYKNFVPDQYALGYPMVANTRRRFGFQAWIKALDDVARKPFIITPFNHGLKKATGFGKEKLYRITMLDMDSMWKYQNKLTQKTAFKQLTQINRNKYENYKYPVYLNNTLVVALFTCLDDITRFVIVGPDGFKKIVATPGFLSSEIYSARSLSSKVKPDSKSNTTNSETDYLVAWTETINDPRWEQRSYSDIIIFDSRNYKTKKLTRHSRYFAPAISPDGKSLIAVKMSLENHCSLVLIDVSDGSETATLLSSDIDFYMTPGWSEDGHSVVFTKLDGEGKSIQLIDLEKHKIISVVPPTYTEISNPVFAQGYILFNGSYSGIENIYAADLMGKQVFQVTSAEFGACNASLSPDGVKIVYSDYSSSGYSLVGARFDPSSWKKLNEIRDSSPSLYKYLVKEESGVLDSANEDSIDYQSEPYRKIAHIFKFHSWAPAYINYMAGENGTGISFMSQNDLSTATTIIGYKYDMAENTGKVTADFSWKAWYPVIDLNTSYGARTAYTGGDTSIRYNFNESIISGGLTLPLLFTGGKYYKGLNLDCHASRYFISDNTSPEENKLSGTIYSLDYRIYAYRYIKQSGKDLNPRWGQFIYSNFRYSPFGDHSLGNIFSGGVRLYLPGLMLHHSIRIDLNRQLKNPGQYAYSNQIVLPRGYLSLNDYALTCYSLNYKFPFAYPDLAFGPVLYLKRLKANLFYDGGKGITHGISRNLQSAGAEITADLHFLRFIFPFDLGFRFGYRPLENRYFTDLLFSVNLSN